MTKGLSHLFPETDLTRIADAVRSAESTTSGEIVPYVAEMSDDYEETIWQAGLFSALLVLVPYAVIHALTETWLPWSVGEVMLSALVVSALSMMTLWFFPRFRLIFASKEKAKLRVAQKAKEAFLHEEVFNTRERTGILIYVSLLEHEVVVLGDSGINAKVEKSAWEEITRYVTNGMQSAKPAEGLIRAIQACGALLERHGVARRADDRDELSDGLRTEEAR